MHFVWVSNTSPWTYSNNRPMVTNPGCTFESGLGVFALDAMKVLPTLNLVRQILGKGPKPNAKQLVRDDDVAWLKVTSPGAPIASQFDGDYLGLRESMTFRAVPRCPGGGRPARQKPHLSCADRKRDEFHKRIFPEKCPGSVVQLCKGFE